MEAELKHLKNEERPAVIDAIATAREHGDLKENAEYKAAREKQGFVEGRIAELSDKVSRAEIVDVAKMSGDKVMFGARVTIEDIETEQTKTYQIVSEYEADLDNGRIANTSPIARAILGRSIGDDIEVKTPKGVVEYEIIEVEYK